MSIISQVKKKAIIATMIGNTLEFYDLALYGLMAPIIVSLFLPQFDIATGLILTFLIPILNIFVRPLGAFIIGRFGDKHGRKGALLFSIFGMALTTGIIGILPTYASIGIIAPLSFSLLRLLQGFFVAGEYNGGAIFVLEHSGEGKKGFLSGLYCMCTVIGVLLASLIATLVAYLPKEYWRVPYILGACTGIIGLYIRASVEETPKFKEYQYVKNIIPQDLYAKAKTSLAVVSTAGLASAMYLLPTLLMNSLLPLATKHSLPTIMTINTFTTGLHMVLLPFFGLLADKISIQRSIFIASVLIFLLSAPLIHLITFDSLALICVMKVIFTILSAWFLAPLHAYTYSLFHVSHRYSLISFAYAIGSQIGGLMVPLCLWTWKNYHIIDTIYIALMVFSLLAAVSLYHARKTPRYN